MKKFEDEKKDEIIAQETEETGQERQKHVFGKGKMFMKTVRLKTLESKDNRWIKAHRTLNGRLQGHKEGG